jgi:hypothetical protein
MWPGTVAVIAVPPCHPGLGTISVSAVVLYLAPPGDGMDNRICKTLASPRSFFRSG